MTERRHPTVYRSRGLLLALWFGIGAAPAFWFLQLVLGYWAWAQRCYPADAPVSGQASALPATLMAFDALCVAIAVAGFVASFLVWRPLRAETPAGTVLVHIGEGRTRFLAVWGMLSSGCFLIAILFATLLSNGVPRCS
ncbi:MAG TPA: hypothetical protein VHZ29_05585 [Rhizomicrobium sp.]|jgi:hypothetical protein|nr:hypothetical protein [Rhizomicrobium sp.]